MRGVGDDNEMTDKELIETLWGGEITLGIVATAADRIEQLNKKLEEANAHAAELEADRRKTYEALRLVSRLHGEVEGQLDRAEWLLTEAMVQLEDGKTKTRRNRAHFIRKFLDEIRGEPK